MSQIETIQLKGSAIISALLKKGRKRCHINTAKSAASRIGVTRTTWAMMEADADHIASAAYKTVHNALNLVGYNLFYNNAPRIGVEKSKAVRLNSVDEIPVLLSKGRKELSSTQAQSANIIGVSRTKLFHMESDPAAVESASWSSVVKALRVAGYILEVEDAFERDTELNNDMEPE